MKTYSSEGCMETMLRDAQRAEHDNYIDNGIIQQQHEEIERLREENRKLRADVIATQRG